jgi:hypothetical protein
MNSIPILSVGIIFVVVISGTILGERFRVAAKLSPCEKSREIFAAWGKLESEERGRGILALSPPFCFRRPQLSNNETQPPEPHSFRF